MGGCVGVGVGVFFMCVVGVDVWVLVWVCFV